MKIKYVNSVNSYDRLYNIFLEVMGLDYTIKQLDDIDNIIVQDTLRLINRVVTTKCKQMLGCIGVKGYYKLDMLSTKELLYNKLAEKKESIILEFYKDNKIVLDMFKYEVVEILGISNYEFNKIKHKLNISGEQIVNVGGIPKKVIKYDRRSVYSFYMENKTNI